MQFLLRAAAPSCTIAELPARLRKCPAARSQADGHMGALPHSARELTAAVALLSVSEPCPSGVDPGFANYLLIPESKRFGAGRAN